MPSSSASGKTKRLKTVRDLSVGEAFDEWIERLNELGLFKAINSVARRNRVTLRELVGRTKPAHITEARKECYQHLRDLGWSYPEIGRLFGRSHPTIITAIGPTSEKWRHKQRQRWRKAHGKDQAEEKE